jgi:tRNA dimethylallyltransferase
MSAGVPVCLCLTAPTGCGKSELALALAERLPLEIVSMDSALVYRGMDIGTAKPAAAARAAVPHHLIDICDPAQSYSAGRFRRDAESAVAAIRSRGHMPLIVGGTLLYWRALRRGLAGLPERDEALRRSLDAEAARQGWPALHRRLAAVDPEAAARIAPGDRQRIQRALEVHALTGRSLTALQRAGARGGGLDVATLALIPEDRARLGERLAARFDRMVADGFVEEVRRLRARGDLDAAMASMRSVGYRQLWAYLAGRYEWSEARERAIAATRQLAKRQLTWLRKERDFDVLPAGSVALEQRLFTWVQAHLKRLKT